MQRATDLPQNHSVSLFRTISQFEKARQLHAHDIEHYYTITYVECRAQRMVQFK